MKTLKKTILETEVLVVSTGAGMGKDSGLPDFRGKDGMWGQVEAEENQSIFEISNPKFLQEDPVKFWQKNARRMQLFAEHAPHQGFKIIQDWIERYQWPYFVLTSNIDGYFQRAGYAKEKIREVHGAMDYLQCAIPCQKNVWENTVDYQQLIENKETNTLPVCPHCGAMARPNIYMFRDNTFLSTRFAQQKMAYLQFLEEVKGKKMLVIEIGSGPHVQTIRMKSRELIKSHQATLVRINPKDYKVREGHFSIPKKALEALIELETMLQS